MYIQKQLPQFEKEKALFVVCGRQIAKIYFAHKGEFKHVESVKYQISKYSDKGGLNIRVRGGQVQRGGWVHEENKHDIVTHFIKELQISLLKIVTKNKVTTMYLFLPKHYQTEIINGLSKSMKNKIKEIYFGNYVDKHPFFLLGKKLESDTKNRRAIKVVAVKEEARKILKKSRKARKVIKGKINGTPKKRS